MRSKMVPWWLSHKQDCRRSMSPPTADPFPSARPSSPPNLVDNESGQVLEDGGQLGNAVDNVRNLCLALPDGHGVVAESHLLRFGEALPQKMENISVSTARPTFQHPQFKSPIQISVPTGSM